MQQDLIVSPRAPSTLERILSDFTDILCGCVIAVAFLFLFLLRPVGVDGASMEPTLYNQQHIVISAFARQLSYEDIVIISEAGTQMQPPRVIVKRVIGLPGDVIDIDFDNGIVLRNDIPLVEDFIAPVDFLRRGDVEFPVTVTPGAAFLLGDNRNNSLDSRHSAIGLVDQNYIIGQFWFALPRLPGAR